MRKILILMILLSAASCIRYDVDEILLVRDDISLTVKGVDQYVYNPLTCQISHNKTKNEYRVYDDKLSGWFLLKCSDMPTDEGQNITADLSWTGDKRQEIMKGLSFKVEKTDGSGKIWLWCKDKSIGIVIKNL